MPYRSFCSLLAALRISSRGCSAGCTADIAVENTNKQHIHSSLSCHVLLPPPPSMVVMLRPSIRRLPLHRNVVPINGRRCRLPSPSTSTRKNTSSVLSLGVPGTRHSVPLSVTHQGSTTQPRARQSTPITAGTLTPGEFCQLSFEICSTEGYPYSGVCASLTEFEACIDLYAPVCGCDGKTYSHLMVRRNLVKQ